MSPEFVHLRVHSEFSLADSIIKVKPLAASVAERNMAAVALTDLANLFGLIKFYGACLDNGVKPIVGVDLLYTSSISTQGVQEDCRVGLLAMNECGYKNLLKLVSTAYQGDDKRGQTSREEIFAHSEGLLVLCGGRDGEVGRSLLKGELDTARQLAGERQAAAP